LRAGNTCIHNDIANFVVSRQDSFALLAYGAMYAFDKRER